MCKVKATIFLFIFIMAIAFSSINNKKHQEIMQTRGVDNKLINILKQNNIIFKNNLIYIPDWVRHIKIDVGLSYNAPITQCWLEKQKNLLVFGFEPNPVALAKLKDPNNIALGNHDKALEYYYINNRAFIIPVALGSENSVLDFYITENDLGCSSLYKPKSSFTEVKNIVKVDVFRLESFFKLLPWQQIKYIEYLKIDAQGHDLEIVKGLGDYISKIIYITLEPETNTYEGCEKNSLENIIAYMKSKNFIYVKHNYTNDPTFLNARYRYKSYVYIEQK